MAGFILRRLLWTIPILWVVLTIVFFMMRSIGGDPFRHGPLLGLSNAGWVKYGDPQPPAIRRNQREKYGLDLPWYQQYGNYLKGRRDTRLSGRRSRFGTCAVTDIIREMAPRSFELVLLAFAWAILIGIPVGILAALRPGSVFDYAVRVLTGLGISLPSFLVATLLIYYVSVKLALLPTSGWDDGLAEQGAADAHPEPRADGLLRAAPARHAARDPGERLRPDGPSKGPVAEAHRRRPRAQELVACR